MTGKIIGNNGIMLNFSQEYKEQLVNELIRLTSVTSVPVISQILTSPPNSGVTPDSYYIVPAGATGAWAGKTNQIAYPLIGINGQPNGDWGFWLPFLGAKISLISGTNLFFNGLNWQPEPGAGDMLIAEYGGSLAGIVAKADEIAGNPDNDTFYGKESGNKGFFGFFSKVLSTTLTGLSTSTGGLITATDTLLIALGKIQNQINNINPSGSVLSTVLTGLSTTTGGVITATDSILQGFGKLQKQLNDLNITGITDGDKGDVIISNSGATWAVKTGTNANSIIRLDSTAKLPAIDGSQLTNLPVLSASQIRDSLATLSDNARLDASAIKNLPSGGSGGLNTVSPTLNNFPAVANDLVIANNFSVALPVSPLENTVIYFLVLESPCQITSTNPITLNLQSAVASFKINPQGFIIPLLFKNSQWNILSTYVSDIDLFTATTFVSNLPPTTTALTSGGAVQTNSWLGSSFTTGGGSGYTLNSVTLRSRQITASANLFVRLYENNLGLLGNLITTFTNPGSITTSDGNNTFTLTTPQTLAANTSFGLVAGTEFCTGGLYSWSGTNSLDQTGESGWSIGDSSLFSGDQGLSWTTSTVANAFQFSVNGYVSPTNSINLSNYQSLGDTNGIIYYLGTTAINSSTFNNPVPTQVIATSSGVDTLYGTLTGATDRNQETLWHGTFIPESSQFYQLDFKNRKVRITRIVMQPRPGGQSGLRPTIVEASNDQVNWTTIHTFTTGAQFPNNLISPELSPAGFFRYLRFRRNDSGEWWYVFSEIELYGFLLL